MKNSPDIFTFNDLVVLSSDKYSETCITKFLKQYPLTTYKNPLNLEHMPESIMNVTNVNFVDINQEDSQLLWRCMEKNQLKTLNNKTCYFFILFEIKGSELLIHSIAFKPELPNNEPGPVKTYLKRYLSSDEEDKSLCTMINQKMCCVDQMEKMPFDRELYQDTTVAQTVTAGTDDKPKNTSVCLFDLVGQFQRTTRKISIDFNKIVSLNKFCSWKEMTIAVNNDSQIESTLNELVFMTLGKMFCGLAVTYYPDFPLEGINFKEIYHLMRDPLRMNLMVDLMVAEIKYKGWHRTANKVVMPQSKGFIWGPLLALKLDMGCVMLRKPGKLPADRIVKKDYTLQYSKDTQEFLPEVFCEGDKVIAFDDCVATGGSLRAVVDLVENEGIEVVGSVIQINIPECWKAASSKFPHKEISFFI